MTERRSGARRGQGFTLLELLIGLAILSLVIVMLTRGVQFAGRAWETQERRIDRADDLGSLQSVLRSLIAAGSEFQGNASSLEFTGEMPRALELSGLFDIELMVSEGRFEIAWRPHLRPGAVPASLNRTELARGVDGLAVSYFVIDPHQGAGNWSSTLLDTKHPPSLVRIVLLLPEQDGRTWPPLVVAPLVERN